VAGSRALAAQQEREAISRRTKYALAVVRSRGVRLGKAIGRSADRRAQDLAPVVEDIRSGGATSLRATAVEQNARGVLTRRGGRWHVSRVMNLLDRLAPSEERCIGARGSCSGGPPRLCYP
jgi:DNA invertase Pin-like site-specific DNA recombinase